MQGFFADDAIAGVIHEESFHVALVVVSRKFLQSLRHNVAFLEVEKVERVVGRWNVLNGNSERALLELRLVECLIQDATECFVVNSIWPALNRATESFKQSQSYDVSKSEKTHALHNMSSSQSSSLMPAALKLDRNLLAGTIPSFNRSPLRKN